MLSLRKKKAKRGIVLARPSISLRPRDSDLLGKMPGSTDALAKRRQRRLHIRRLAVHRHRPRLLFTLLQVVHRGWKGGHHLDGVAPGDGHLRSHGESQRSCPCRMRPRTPSREIQCTTPRILYRMFEGHPLYWDAERLAMDRYPRRRLAMQWLPRRHP